MSVNYDSVVSQLQSAGLILRDGLRFGKLVRCAVDGDREKRGWYTLHEIVGSRGDSLIVGSFGVWAGNDPGAQKIQLEKAAELSTEQKEAIRQRLADDRRRADLDRAAEAKRAAQWATKVWAKLSLDGESAYLTGKGVLGHGIRYSAKGAIAIPIQDTAGNIHGLELIRDKATAAAQGKLAKEFWPAGLVKKGHFFHIGPSPDAVFLAAEGYATGATLFEATGLPVVVTFDAGNLPHVVAAYKKRYPRARALICTDDDNLAKCSKRTDTAPVCGTRFILDQHPETCPGCGQAHQRSNAGVIAASAAALAHGGAWIKPQFADEAGRHALFLERGQKLTDFNDLHQRESLAAVRTQVETRLLELRWSTRPAAPAPAATQGGGEASEALKPIGDGHLLLERFSLVYGMKGVVFDHQEHQLVPLSDMREICRHKEVYKVWQESPDRMIVRVDEVGFDPTERDASVRCNLWRGWPTRAKSGQCQKLLDLLRYMCSDDKHARGLYDFVIKWLAYPLQHPGAKMKSTLVLHGPQGTGKNLFFEAYMGIYGRYGRVINQDAIEDKFNDWASRKLFLIADEVVARSDLYHIKNKLKAFITGDWIRINPKNMGAYDERNHVNLVFLSNEVMPVVLEEDDRRHCVIWTPEKLPADTYRAVLAEIEAGGVAALHDYLLHLDLGDFTNATNPPESDAKRDLINQSMDSTSRYWYALENGDLVPGKLGPALSTDVYRLYCAYCRVHGLRAANHPKLVNVLKRKHGVTDSRERYTKGFESVGPAGLLHLGDLEPPLDGSRRDWLGDCIEAFRNAVNDYAGAAAHA